MSVVVHWIMCVFNLAIYISSIAKYTSPKLPPMTDNPPPPVTNGRDNNEQEHGGGGK